MPIMLSDGLGEDSISAFSSSARCLRYCTVDADSEEISGLEERSDNDDGGPVGVGGGSSSRAREKREILCACDTKPMK